MPSRSARAAGRRGTGSTRDVCPPPSARGCGRPAAKTIRVRLDVLHDLPTRSRALRYSASVGLRFVTTFAGAWVLHRPVGGPGREARRRRSAPRAAFAGACSGCQRTQAAVLFFWRRSSSASGWEGRGAINTSVKSSSDRFREARASTGLVEDERCRRRATRDPFARRALPRLVRGRGRCRRRHGPWLCLRIRDRGLGGCRQETRSRIGA